jgi:hypothetical protein
MILNSAHAQLEKAVRAEGSVETWLTALLQTSQSSLHSIIRSSNTMINDANFNLLAFLDKMPAQVFFSKFYPLLQRLMQCLCRLGCWASR